MTIQKQTSVRPQKSECQAEREARLQATSDKQPADDPPKKRGPGRPKKSETAKKQDAEAKKQDEAGHSSAGNSKKSEAAKKAENESKEQDEAGSSSPRKRKPAADKQDAGARSACAEVSDPGRPTNIQRVRLPRSRMSLVLAAHVSQSLQPTSRIQVRKARVQRLHAVKG